MPETSRSTFTSSPRARRTIVPRRGSRAARSSLEISVGWSPVRPASCSCDRPAAVRSRRRFAANRSSGVTRAILDEVSQ
jgi:hypothetical protein